MAGRKPGSAIPATTPARRIKEMRIHYIKSAPRAQGGTYVHKRVDIILPDGKRRKAYASTESSSSSYGIPVILIWDVPHGYGDLAIQGAVIVTRDAELLDLLNRHGFVAKAATTKMITTGVSLEMYEALKAKADARGVSLAAIMWEALAEWLEKEDA